jgi:CMP-N-acetylneuraminic acid synthetase
VAKRAVRLPKVLAVVPVRGQVVDPASYPLKLLGGRPLIDWTLAEALSCSSINRVVVSSPDDSVLDFVRTRYTGDVGIYSRTKEHAGLNVSLEPTLQDVLRSERDYGQSYDAVMTLTVEYPFRTRMYMQQAISVMQLFATDGVIGVRHEDELFYRHDGIGLEPVRRDSRMRMERDDLFRACGGFSLEVLTEYSEDMKNYVSAIKKTKSRLGHVLLDQMAAFGLRTELDWEIAEYLVGVQGSGGQS